MMLAPTFRVTWLRNSCQLLFIQCLLSAFRITHPASPIWYFYSLFLYASSGNLHMRRSPQTHIPLFSFPRWSNADAMWVIYSITFYTTHVIELWSKRKSQFLKSYCSSYQVVKLILVLCSRMKTKIDSFNLFYYT